MVRLHALQCVNVDTFAFEIYWAALRDDTSLNRTCWPECVSHLTPWFLRIGTEVAGTILAGDKAWRRPRDCQIYYALLVCG